MREVIKFLLKRSVNVQPTKNGQWQIMDQSVLEAFWYDLLHRSPRIAVYNLRWQWHYRNQPKAP